MQTVMEIKRELLSEKASLIAEQVDILSEKARLHEQSEKFDELTLKTERLIQILELKIQYFDSIAVSYQHGRLDIVSLILAVVTIAIGIAALFGFGVVRRAAQDAAKEEMRKLAASTFGDANSISASPVPKQKAPKPLVDKVREDEILDTAVERIEEGGRDVGDL